MLKYYDSLNVLKIQKKKVGFGIYLWGCVSDR